MFYRSDHLTNLSKGTGEYFPPPQFTCRNCGGGDRGRVAIYRPFGEVSLSLNRTVTCMVLKANDRRTSCPCHDEFRGPRSDYVRQVALATTTTTKQSTVFFFFLEHEIVSSDITSVHPTLIQLDINQGSMPVNVFFVVQKNKVWTNGISEQMSVG
ncbi:uncharacterized protein TNCV_3599901 [Trichonephila clavipes]|nr:uncharacterized protein TNCV_3599901 [Trichonephila clavipes]